MEKLITDYRFELVEDHHHPGSGRYGVLVTLIGDISAVLPYLNNVLDDTWYDHENKVLIGTSGNWRCAFRPHEIRVAVAADSSNASRIANELVDLVNRVWKEHDRIVPSLRERKLPAIYDIFRFLPQTNCRQCGCSTCLAYAAKLRRGEIQLVQCPLLSQPGYVDKREQIAALFSSL